jgi:rubrerythrin
MERVSNAILIHRFQATMAMATRSNQPRHTDATLRQNVTVREGREERIEAKERRIRQMAERRKAYAEEKRGERRRIVELKDAQDSERNKRQERRSSFTESPDTTACGICLRDIKESRANSLTCGHAFCTGCIAKWTLSGAANRRRCPTCRTDMSQTS